PRPYPLEILELGNEERVDEGYFQRFRALAEAIWTRDREVTLVVGDFAYEKPFQDPDHIEGAASRIGSLAAHRKILDLARARGRRVWFDVHVWNEEPRQPDGLGGVPSFTRAIAGMNPEARVVVFELNANKHGLGRALGNAHAMNELERIGDRVPIVCSANCLQPDGQNDNGWDQGLLFLNPSQVWLQPPGYVTQMLARNRLPQAVPCEVTGEQAKLDVVAKRSAD